MAYTLTLHTEGDGTADPTTVEGIGDGRRDDDPQGGRRGDLPSPPRASATLDIVSSPTMVDVATTMVNQADQSTDTVVLHIGNRDKNN